MTQKYLGIGIGLRVPHYEYIFENKPDIDWFEIISENFMVDGGKPIANLEQILERYTVVQHGVSMSIGSTDPLDFDYLKRLKDLTKKTKTPWFSDHLCWTSVNHKNMHDLLPLPYAETAIKHIAERARIVQDYMEIPFALENLSSYVSYKQDEMTEWEFYTEVVERSGCYMMLDINNVYVSSRNHNFDPNDYINYVPANKILQVHVAGHTDKGSYCLDTHNNYVIDDVWELYRKVWKKTGGVSTLLEWDEDFISFEETHQEALKAKQYQEDVNAKLKQVY